ncbi:MAG: DUF6809 family protein [Faecalispora jeddahensis]|uniref:DUF6809 family protein n=1 Tax=Faecalispora jeddahensis TaxID=1414721 RepID=UPI003991AB7D
MQKEKILSELYHGNINPVAKSVVQGSSYQKAMHKISTLEEKLMSQLDKEQQKLLQDFISVQGELNYISGEERFTDGFRMGAKLILEIFEKDGEQFKPIIG